MNRRVGKGRFEYLADWNHNVGIWGVKDRYMAREIKWLLPSGKKHSFRSAAVKSQSGLEGGAVVM